MSIILECDVCGYSSEDDMDFKHTADKLLVCDRCYENGMEIVVEYNKFENDI